VDDNIATASCLGYTAITNSTDRAGGSSSAVDQSTTYPVVDGSKTAASLHQEKMTAKNNTKIHIFIICNL
jgi:hypothetical protein